MIVMTAIDSRNRFANTLKELAAKKTLEKITTEEIVKAAGVSRQTFYKFFSDKYDLAFWCYQRDMAPVIQEYTDVKISFHEMNVRMLEMLQQEKNFYRNVFAHYEVQNSFFRQYHRFSCDNTVSFFGRVDKKMRTIIDLYCYGCNLAMLNWVVGGMKESPEFMAELFDLSLPDCLKRMASEG